MEKPFDFSSLNPEQKKAVLSTEGRVLILAGAGSGKTRVIIYRTAYLLAKGVCPKSILGLTFTNKAASEMKQRLSKMVGRETASKVTFCTFHSFCMNLLRKEISPLGYTSSFTLYDERDIHRLAKELGKEILQTKEIPSITSSLERIAQVENEHCNQEIDGFTKKLQSALKTTLKAYNAVNFDSLLTLTVELFTRYPEVLKKYQEKYLYIMIDEYQDTNRVQSKLAELLAKKYHHLCVVGDDDQSIYGWRGALVENILAFQADILIRLEQNYRCYPSILQAANQVIACNKKRHTKTLFSKSKKDLPIELFHAPSEQEEAQAVVDRIIELHQRENIAFKDMAILYRSNLLSRNFEFALMNALYKEKESWIRGIPYRVYGGIEFSERSEIKDLLAYLKLIANRKDQESLLRILNVPRRGISSKTVDLLTSFQRREKKDLWEILKNVESFQNSFETKISSKGLEGIKSFVQLIQEAEKVFLNHSLSKSFSWLVQKIGYHAQLQEEVQNEKALQYKWENVLQLGYTLEKYEEEQEGASLPHFIANTMLARSFPSEKFGKEKEQINLSTFHSAKGLEFEACFIVALEDHILPHEKSLLETGIEEERRLFYVALTRAKKFLTLSMSRKRKKMGKEIPTNPSRFLFDISKSLLKMTSFKKESS